MCTIHVQTQRLQTLIVSKSEARDGVWAHRMHRVRLTLDLLHQARCNGHFWGTCLRLRSHCADAVPLFLSLCALLRARGHAAVLTRRAPWSTRCNTVRCRRRRLPPCRRNRRRQHTFGSTYLYRCRCRSPWGWASPHRACRAVRRPCSSRLARTQ